MKRCDFKSFKTKVRNLSSSILCGGERELPISFPGNEKSEELGLVQEEEGKQKRKVISRPSGCPGVIHGLNVN